MFNLPGMPNSQTRYWQPCADHPTRCKWARNGWFEWQGPWPPWMDAELLAEFGQARTPGVACEQSPAGTAHSTAVEHCGRWRSSDEALLAAVALARQNESVFFLSMRDLLCNSSEASHAVCGPNLGKTYVVAYSDGHHYNKAGSLFLWPFICSAFESFSFYSASTQDSISGSGERIIVY